MWIVCQADDPYEISGLIFSEKKKKKKKKKKKCRLLQMLDSYRNNFIGFILL